MENKIEKAFKFGTAAAIAGDGLAVHKAALAAVEALAPSKAYDTTRFNKPLMPYLAKKWQRLFKDASYMDIGFPLCADKPVFRMATKPQISGNVCWQLETALLTDAQVTKPNVIMTITSSKEDVAICNKCLSKRYMKQPWRVNIIYKLFITVSFDNLNKPKYISEVVERAAKAFAIDEERPVLSIDGVHVYGRLSESLLFSWRDRRKSLNTLKAMLKKKGITYPI